VTLCDQPLVGREALERLVAARGDARTVVASTYAGTVGVPALFGAEHFTKLLALAGATGAKPLLASYGPGVTLVECPEAVLDVDVREDLARLDALVDPPPRPIDSD
jgi:molybdenum cofactor cytidylyltransferase